MCLLPVFLTRPVIYPEAVFKTSRPASTAAHQLKSILYYSMLWVGGSCSAINDIYLIYIPDSRGVRLPSPSLLAKRPWATSVRSSLCMNTGMLLIWVLNAWWLHRMNESAISNFAAWSLSWCSTTAVPHTLPTSSRTLSSGPCTAELLFAGKPRNRIPIQRFLPSCPPCSCHLPVPAPLMSASSFQ